MDNKVYLRTMNECHHRASGDRISELPCHITQTILMFLPLEDVLRTSVLSRYWRFQWTKVPQLLFDLERSCPADRVFGILLLHEGAIFKFTFSMAGWRPNSEINKMMQYLSRNGIQELRISKANEEQNNLLSSISSCAKLKYLSLCSCKFKTFRFDGFNKLKALELLGVSLDTYVSISSCPLLESLKMEILTIVDQLDVDAPNLKKLFLTGSISYIGIMITPLLKDLSLSHKEWYMRGSTFDLMKLLCSLPHLENISLHYKLLQLLALGVSPNKRITVLNNLTKLELTCASLSNKDELSSALWLIRNSPNLLRLKLKYPEASEFDGEIGLNLEMQEYSNIFLQKLQEVDMIFDEVIGWSNLRPAVEFLKFLLVVSPELERIYVDTSLADLDVSEANMLKELARHRRVSPKAQIVLNKKIS